MERYSAAIAVSAWFALVTMAL